jgi:hypothetical protein
MYFFSTFTHPPPPNLTSFNPKKKGKKKRNKKSKRTKEKQENFKRVVVPNDPLVECKPILIIGDNLQPHPPKIAL